ncbi:MAG TPA: hypothetical protein GXX15_04645 [Clostridia bacterium]|nr:hypothetical protein [Clostridia bacterium]
MQVKGGAQKNNYFYIAIILLLLIFCVSSFTYFYLLLNSQLLVKGIFINGIPVGGVPKDQAFNFIKKEITVSPFSITVTYQDKNYTITSQDIGLFYDYKQMIDEVYKIGRQGNPIERLKDIYEAQREGKYFTFYPKYEENRLKKFIEEISQDLYREPVNAKIKIKRGIIEITPDAPGLRVNKDKTFEDLKKLIEELIKGNKVNPQVSITVNKIEAAITKSMLEMINGKISTFSTVFNAEEVNRTGNLTLAAKAVDGTLVMPGEVFSLNKTLGPRIIENGYKEAPVIIDNKLVPAIGGGICQVATTLYNAALRSNIAIIERYPHSFPISYVPPGQDATISGDVLDLKFKNSTQYPIYVESYIEGNKLTMNIYGYVENPSRWIDIQTEIVEKYEPKVKYIEDPTLPEGEEVIDVQPHTGYKVKVYRLIYENNKLIKKEFLYTDLYKPVDGVIKKGTKKVENPISKKEPTNSTAAEGVKLPAEDDSSTQQSNP